MTRQQQAVADKRRALRQEYGGMMSIKQLAHEIGLKDPRAVKRWARDNGLDFILMPGYAGRKVPRFQTDQLAKILVSKTRPAKSLR